MKYSVCLLLLMIYSLFYIAGVLWLPSFITANNDRDYASRSLIWFHLLHRLNWFYEMFEVKRKIDSLFFSTHYILCTYWNKGHYIPLNISTCTGFLKRYSTFQIDVTWVKVNSKCIENFLEAVLLNLIACVFQDRVPLNI